MKNSRKTKTMVEAETSGEKKSEKVFFKETQKIF